MLDSSKEGFWRALVRPSHEDCVLPRWPMFYFLQCSALGVSWGICPVAAEKCKCFFQSSSSSAFCFSCLFLLPWRMFWRSIFVQTFGDVFKRLHTRSVRRCGAVERIGLQQAKVLHRCIPFNTKVTSPCRVWLVLMLLYHVLCTMYVCHRKPFQSQSNRLSKMLKKWK